MRTMRRSSAFKQATPSPRTRRAPRRPIFSAVSSTTRPLEGTDILDDIGALPGATGFTGPLGAGTYTLWLNQTGNVTSTASFTLVTQEVGASAPVVTASAFADLSDDDDAAASLFDDAIGADAPLADVDAFMFDDPTLTPSGVTNDAFEIA